MLAPLVVICLTAFMPESTLSMPGFLTPWSGFSLRWFRAIFERPGFATSFWSSILLATISAMISVPSLNRTGRIREKSGPFSQAPAGSGSGDG